MQQDLLQEDTQSRELALAIDSFIVEAPAGAGKTELLTQRFLKLLNHVDAPEEVIAITFTNKAASEMKSRIMDSLALAATGDLPALAHKQITFKLGQAVLTRSAELNWQLLETPSRLRIYTIDSLSANLARQMPLLSRFGTQPSILDDPSTHYEAAATRAIELLDHEAYGNTVHQALSYFDNDSYKLTQLLADMLAKRDQWLTYTQTNHSAQMAEKALTQMIQSDMQSAVNVLSLNVQTRLMPIARFAASNLESNSAIAPLLDWQDPLKNNPENLSQWQALASLLLTNNGTFRKSFNKTMGLPAIPESKAHKEALTTLIAELQQDSHAETAIAQLRQLPSPKQSEDIWQMIATLAQLLHIAVGELWLVFQAKGEVDFVEVANRALLALEDISGNTTELAMKLDYRIQHLLVDEFQDTSPSQIKLIQALTNGWQPDDGRTLFCVGDPMQSIYRFRKANVGLFLQTAQYGIGDIILKPLKLWRNNRSTPEVVAWVNTTFPSVFPEQDSTTRGAIQYRPFVATKSSEDGAGVTVHAMIHNKHSGHSETEASTGTETYGENDIRQLEADRIIHIIQQTRLEKPDAKIAVLVRARNHLKALVTEIRRKHPTLSFQAVEIEELANRQIVQDLLSLTYALHQRADRVHWLAILRAPWCGLTLADLHTLMAGDKTSTLMELMHDQHRLAKLSKDGLNRLLHVRKVLDQALAHQGRMTVSRWIHGVWLMLGGADCLWDSGDVRDVQAFFDHIQQLELAGQFTPQHLAKEVEKLYAAPDAKADDSLQFMTIHKSKGLEFDTVILPGLDRSTGGHDQPLLLWEEVSSKDATHDDINLVVAPYIPKGQKNDAVTPYDYLKQLEKERAAYEDARVLYVAITRAERCLHLVGAAKTDKHGNMSAPSNTFLSMLWPVIQSQFIEENFIQTQPSEKTSSTISIETFTPKLIRLNHPQVPTVLAATPPAQNHSNQSTETENKEQLDADIGTLTHFYLQMIAEQSISNWSTSRISALSTAMQRWFKQKHYDDQQCASGTMRVTHSLQATLESAEGQWVLSHRENAANELAIESNTQDGTLKKVIDRTFIEDGKRWIIDYKTVLLDHNSNEAKLKTIAQQYQAQLLAYEKLFAQDGLPIQKAIFFTSIGKLISI
jgi:ATP-dependent helicase/nuclease subunit A